MAYEMPPPAYNEIVSPGESSSFASHIPATQVEIHISCRYVSKLSNYWACSVLKRLIVLLSSRTLYFYTQHV